MRSTGGDNYIFYPDGEPFMEGLDIDLIDEQKVRLDIPSRVVRAGEQVIRILDPSKRELGDNSDASLSPLPTEEEIALYTTLEGVQEQLRVADRHHNKLREFGMRIPKVQWLIGSRLDPDGKLFPVGYGVTPYIESKTLDATQLDPLETMDHLVLPLARYYHWIASSREHHLLGDLIGGRIGWQDEPAVAFSQTPDGEIFLHDIEPKAKVSTSSRGAIVMNHAHLDFASIHTGYDDYLNIATRRADELEWSEDRIEDVLAPRCEEVFELILETESLFTQWRRDASVIS